MKDLMDILKPTLYLLLALVLFLGAGQIVNDIAHGHYAYIYITIGGCIIYKIGAAIYHRTNSNKEDCPNT